MKKFKQFLHYLLLIFLLFLTSSWLSQILYQQSIAIRLTYLAPDDSAFREQRLAETELQPFFELSQASQLSPGELMLIGNCISPGRPFSGVYGSDESVYLKWKYQMLKYNSEGYEKLEAAYGAVWNDIECFPVLSNGITFENSWMFERNYGGKRGHEGTDLMPSENIPGHYPVISMTDGVVEKIGWLEKGGWRIGIRSPSGGYFYYAHLDQYSRDFQVGDVVTAGTALGKMGDTGYGPEGTRGKFDVHLHLGIYIRTQEHEELSVNPYWILNYVRQYM